MTVCTAPTSPAAKERSPERANFVAAIISDLTSFVLGMAGLVTRGPIWSLGCGGERLRSMDVERG